MADITVPLSVPAIAAALGGAACRFDIDLRAECGSTNAELLARAASGAPSGTVLAAERQTAGRGRMGREWLAAAGDSLTFSLLWRFADGIDLSGLSLAAGVAVARALEKLGRPLAAEGAPRSGGVASASGMRDAELRSAAAASASAVASPQAGLLLHAPASLSATALKWPNDVLKDGRKLGGILIELQSNTAAVIGIGLNLRLPAAMPDEIRASAAALDSDVDPNLLLAALLRELLAVLDAFAVAGFAAVREEWLARHAWTGRPVRVLMPHAAPLEGICAGIASDGALLLETAAGVRRILSGDVSLRLQ
ncbi:biotin--[acetyl-CoA-carboxylase] ligase [Sulfurisoma sediminicola]|uniref:biotin--[biotin carboxyl-carrier protein] ligase n=1 Tax=Sulfurisoma sediminicola TaxID=1381557 RepID=A0A497XJ67_9PROT|nr:biotin--[acetyl-CoA-carboxylase] ligase [Sulfurisoma sediminicola]RLJ67914.1 BirA family biotin operon repressor/biotin-[acetyl-CoA-carboxylase] ligase [Sulfurisoma sediminicola]